MTTVLRPGRGDTDGVQLDRGEQFGDAVKGGYAEARRGRVCDALVHITDGRQMRAFAGLVDTGVRSADVAHSNNCYVQHEASSSF